METKNNKCVYHITIGGNQAAKVFSDERIKKQFLDELRIAKKENEFKVYSYCLTNDEGHFLVHFSGKSKVSSFSKRIKTYLKKCCQRYEINDVEQIQVSNQKLVLTDQELLWKYIRQIHFYALSCAARLEDHWWSSYNDYTNKNYTGLIQTGEVLETFHPNPRKAVQEFVLYHKNITRKKTH